MRTTCILILACALFLGCQKDNENESESLQGNFAGFFHRTGMDSIGVFLNFHEDNRFDGRSGRDKYPAICSGTFSIDDNRITFSDTCTWTADFDWSLILDNTFTLINKDSVVVLTRTTGNVTDEYRLMRLTR